MKTGVIIQARMGSTRLPGKVLIHMSSGITLLEFMITRVKKASCVDEVIVATTVEKNDDPIYELCRSRDIKCFRGSENDVLKRYFDCATLYALENIIRLTADCPLIDPDVVDECVREYTSGNFDYFSNTCPPVSSTFPDGSDVEIFSYKALKIAHEEATKKSDREHVTFYFWKNKDLRFKAGLLTSSVDYSSYRYTVDYPEDFEVVSFIANEIEDKRIEGSVSEISKILDDNPGIKKLNAQYYPGIGWENG